MSRAFDSANRDSRNFYSKFSINQLGVLKRNFNSKLSFDLFGGEGKNSSLRASFATDFIFFDLRTLDVMIM